MNETNNVSNKQNSRLSTSSKGSGNASPNLRRTPLSNSERNARSLQDIRSATPSKQLLPKPLRKLSMATSESSLVSLLSVPLTIVPASAATSITVAPPDSEGEVA